MKKELTLEENVAEIVKSLKVNSDYVGNNGMIHVQINISFLNMVGLIVKFFFAMLVASPIIVFIAIVIAKVFQVVLGIDFSSLSQLR